MANYPILNSNSSEVSRRKSVRRRARERHTGGLQRPLPHGHTDTQRHTQSHPPSTFHFNTSEIGGKGASSTALPRGTWLRASHLPPRVWVGGAKGPRGVASLCQLVRPWEGAPQAISFLWLGGGPPPPTALAPQPVAFLSTEAGAPRQSRPTPEPWLADTRCRGVIPNFKCFFSFGRTGLWSGCGWRAWKQAAREPEGQRDSGLP